MRYRAIKKLSLARQCGFIGTLLGFALLTAGTASADTTDILLNQLKAKGILTKEEYRKLKERHAAEVAAQHQKQHQIVTARRAVPAETAATDDRFVTRLDRGIGVRIGSVDVTIAGDATFFATEVFNPHHGPQIDGSLMNTAANNSFSLRGGLPPSAFITNLATTQEGMDIGFTLGLYIGGTNVNVGLLNANSPGITAALGTPGIDVRQIYGTIGTPDFGTVKIGRDLGLFGGDAIFNDDTIFGAGIPYFNGAPRNTTLGRIGYGYIYADYLPQVTYTSPNINGFTATIGAFSPLSTFSFAGAPTGSSGSLTAHDQPMFQGRLKYVGNVTEGVKMTAWVSALTQQHRAEVGDAVNLTPGTNVRSVATDMGVRFDIDRVSFSGSAYYGVGVGNAALFFDGVTYNGVKRKSYGGYAQASYKVLDKLKIGASYGISLLEGVYGDPGTLIRSSDAYVGFARYQLTDWVSLEAEYIHTTSRNQFYQRLDNNALVLGSAIVF
ncbi:hypothetical protein [Beijerinckia indica]|uniref:Porin domain-containing protein n=1 Tax=Beijerinckia indica subsp. indica (strain ATCC 9039 / DSM 1715 / NCIMB 8712) TaxID=395963 RepID=B2ID51_BEII9|nr:hypothetical protein [Beijerinckia indica]ACB96816.1 conserved hypothetical protein [Beijerinckia indica subsp. indica ATCC 9039]